MKVEKNQLNFRKIHIKVVRFFDWIFHSLKTFWNSVNDTNLLWPVEPTVAIKRFSFRFYTICVMLSSLLIICWFSLTRSQFLSLIEWLQTIQEETPNVRKIPKHHDENSPRDTFPLSTQMEKCERNLNVKVADENRSIFLSLSLVTIFDHHHEVLFSYHIWTFYQHFHWHSINTR